MDLSVLVKRSALALGGLLALTAGAGSMQATVTTLLTSTLVANVAPIAVAGVTCATQTGPPLSPQSVVIRAFPAPAVGHTVTIGVTQTPGLKVTPAAGLVLSSTNNTAGLTFNVNSTAGCSNAFGITANTLINGANTIAVVLTAQTDAGAVNTDNPLTVTDTITTGAGTSALVAANVTVTCGYNSTGPVYTPGTPQTVSVSSAANLGTPFSVTTAGLPAWLVLGPTAPSGTAGTTAVNFTVQAVSPCNSLTSGTATYALPLASSPAPAVNVTITLKIIAAVTPLTVTPVPASPTLSMSYTKFSGTPATQTVNLISSIATGAAPTYYQTVNYPIWLTVNYASGFIPVTLGKNVNFSTTSAADSLSPGTYTATVYVQVANYPDTPITITLLVQNKAPTLSVTSANPLPVLYTLGGATPISTITVVSTDSPIPYTISFGGVLAPTLAAGLNQQLTGIAYSFGSNIYITYNPVLFESSAPGTVLSGTVTFTWGSSTPATVTVVTINLTVGSPAALLTSISPASLPTAAPGSVFTVTLTGSGFVGGTDPTLATKVGYVTGSNPGSVVQDPNMRAVYVNPSNMTLQITVPALVSGGNGDAILPFLVGGAGGPVLLGIVNGSSTTPTGTATLTIGANPIIYGVTSSSSFTEVSGGALPAFAPYDMVSIFGSNFCASQITFPAVSPNPSFTNGGCTSTTILPGKPDSVYGVFPFSLTPDQSILPIPPVSSLWRNLTVTFYPHGTLSGGTIAPLLFATNGQINAIVPGALTMAPTEYDIVVGFGQLGAVATSTPFPVNIQATDPGVFTIGSDGQGPAAALNLSYSLINAANPAAMRSGVGNSDTVQLYVTGLGVPANGSAIYTSNSGICISPLNGGFAGYLTALNAQTSTPGSFTAIDGAVFNYSLFTGDFPPCLTATNVAVTIGGVATATPTFAGFVDGTVAGLYQIDVVLPRTDVLLKPNFPSLTGDVNPMIVPMQLPVFVTVNSVTSQAGVYINVAPRLKMVSTLPSMATVGIPYTGTITASLGTTTYSFAVTSGVLPAGLTLSPSGAVLTIAGTPLENTSGTYNFTVTATDSAAAPLTGSIPITITVAGGLYVTETGSSPFSGSVFGSAGMSLPVITAIGGTGPYTYTPTVETVASFGGGSLTAPTGMTAPGAVTGAFATTGAVVAGTYQVVVTATDSLGVTGTINFVDSIALLMAVPSTTDNTTLVAASGGTVATVQVTGFTGTAMTCVTTPVIAGLSCAVDAGGLATITASAGGLTAAMSHTFTITVTDNATAAAAETGTFGVGTSVGITVDPT
jgi:uncharacterized protein (TIGR03437 family)